ncbi:hypothetical protein GC177_10985 [bacterium]|nr:hypothetical protein [bacterium]
MRVLLYKEDDPFLKAGAWEGQGHEVLFVDRALLKLNTSEERFEERDFLYLPDKEYQGEYKRALLPDDLEERAHVLERLEMSAILTRSHAMSELATMMENGLTTPILVGTAGYDAPSQDAEFNTLRASLFNFGASAVIRESELLHSVAPNLTPPLRYRSATGMLRAPIPSRADARAIAHLALHESGLISSMMGDSYLLYIANHPHEGVYWNPDSRIDTFSSR